MQLFPSRDQLRGRLLPEAFAAAAVGGVVGSTARWLVGEGIVTGAGDWPWATLLVNVLGCALIGLAARRVTRGSLLWDFVVTGVLGGFTTMSAFAVEVNDLIDAGRANLAVAYVVVSAGAGVGAASVGAAVRPRERGGRS